MALVQLYRDMGAGVAINPPFPILNRVNAILNGANTRYHAYDYAGTLSIKCVFGGQAIYEAAGGRFAVDDGGFLILNDGQTYTMSIEADRTVETFCLFFRPGFAEQALHGLVTPTDPSDDPRAASRQPVLFFERLYPHDDVLTPVIRELHAAVKTAGPSAGWFEERFYVALERLLWMHRGLRSEIDALPAVRAATRAELFRRLHRARDFMEASLHEPLTLDRIADVAWLSPHHFLRLFKQAFGETPHQYLTRRRLVKAQRLLLSTDLPIVQVAQEVGFESHSAFSRLFRLHHGLSPDSYRRSGHLDTQ